MFTLPDLPYGFDALEPYIDKQTMQIHHDKHHAGYVKNLSDALPDKQDDDLEGILKNLSAVSEEVRTKVRNNGGGHYNHTLFWQMMVPKGGQPQGKLADALNSNFGSLDTFKEKFASAATGRFGSGWAWLIVDGGKLLVDSTPNQDNPIMEGKSVILGLDVWEHAYYLKYQNKRADYISAWWNVVNWDFVSLRFSEIA